MQNPNWQGASPETAGNVLPGGQAGTVIQPGMNRPQQTAPDVSQAPNLNCQVSPGMTFRTGGPAGPVQTETATPHMVAGTLQVSPGVTFPSGDQAVLPRVDVLETDAEFIYVFEVPGPEPDQINVEVSAREIALTGPESTASPASRYHYLERPQGRYMRLLRTPPNVNTNDATARYRYGELELHLPKKR